MHRARLIVMALAAVSAVAVASCGEDTEEKNEYVDAVNEVTTTLNQGLTELTSGAGATSPTDAAALYTDFAKEVDTAAADIEAIEHPEGVGSSHDELVSQLQELSGAATSTADEIDAGGPAAITGATNQFLAESTKLGTEVSTTIDDINSKLQD